MSDEFAEVTPKDNRQGQIEACDIGDSITLSRRLDLGFAISPEAIKGHTAQLRAVLDTQVSRIRKRFKERKYVVENGSFVSSRGEAIIINVVATRLQ